MTLTEHLPRLAERVVSAAPSLLDHTLRKISPWSGNVVTGLSRMAPLISSSPTATAIYRLVDMLREHRTAVAAPPAGVPSKHPRGRALLVPYLN